MSVPRNLPDLVRAKAKAAQEAGYLTVYITHVAVPKYEGIPYQLRYCPALANKPKVAKDHSSKPRNPFENITEHSELFISEVSPYHNLILNKFPINPEHFILVTKEFKDQSHLLEESDLSAMYACLKAYQESGEELFGFFNSGQHSGASQPHRHIQFLPVKSMHLGVDPSHNWRLLADQISESSLNLPFTYFSAILPKTPLPQELQKMYLDLYEKAARAVAIAGFPTIKGSAKNASKISYNMGFTREVMILCPRLSEGTEFKVDGGAVIGPVNLNGTILGGTLLVKTEMEFDTLRKDCLKLKDILHAIGIPMHPSSFDKKLNL